MSNLSKDIFQRQNMPSMIDAQKVAKCCYSNGKKIAVISFIIAIVYPIIVNIVILFVNNNIVNSILDFGLIISFILSFFINAKIKQAKKHGAGMQQYFDEYVFDLKDNCKRYRYTEKLSVDTRTRLMNKYQKVDNKNFANWYSDYSSLSYEEAVFNCQKENIRWDLEIRKKYRNLQIVFFIVVVVAFAIHGICKHMYISDVVTIIVSLLPLVSYYANGLIKLSKDIKKQKELCRHSKEIEINIKSKRKLWDEIEALQVEIYKYRLEAYLIPDGFYKIYRKNMQRYEDDLAKKITEEIYSKQKGK